MFQAYPGVGGNDIPLKETCGGNGQLNKKCEDAVKEGQRREGTCDRGTYNCRLL